MAIPDREMLERCLEAFVAVQGADSARRLMRKWQLKQPYGLNRKQILAAHMTQELLRHMRENAIDLPLFIKRRA